jgi:hypothetical protein
MCKTVGNFAFANKKPRNRKSIFETDKNLPCQHHAENTCCMINDISRIYYNLNQYVKPEPKNIKVEINNFERNGDIFAQANEENSI